jgi:hypothetical protein
VYQGFLETPDYSFPGVEEDRIFEKLGITCRKGREGGRGGTVF